MPEFFPETPESEYSRDAERMKAAFKNPDDPGLKNLPDVKFCSEWNPEFSFNGQRCCRSLANVHARKNRRSCFSRHPHGDFCSEETDEQREYQQAAESGQLGDILDLISHEMGHTEQAYCTANNGFLAHGRPIVPSPKNRIALRDPTRCTQFGTDYMIGMVEWLGRQVGTTYASPEFSRVHLLIGDIAAPRGGCLSGNSGPIGHLSHTNGEDADIGLLNARSGHASPDGFTTDFDPKANWWMIKQILKNPYACVKVIFLDRRHIRKLAKVASRDEEWSELRRFIRHVRGHRNHMHVRIGEHPGPPGCSPGANPEMEELLEDQELVEAVSYKTEQNY